jgi:hypothetical protein
MWLPISFSTAKIICSAASNFQQEELTKIYSSPSYAEQID